MSVEVIFIKTSTYLPSGFQNLIMKKISLIFLFSFFLFASRSNAQVFTPTVRIASSQNNFCQGSSVIIKATPAVGDTVLSYNFIVNGVSQQNSSVDSFISTTFANNDSVICILHSSKYNANPDSAISNTIHLQVKKKSTKSVNKVICPNAGGYLFNGTLYTSTGTYTAVLPNAVGCDSTITLHLVVDIAPTVTITPQIDSVCSGGMKILTASGALNYSWNPSSIGGITDTVMPTNTTTYTVIGTDLYGCADTAQAVIIVSNAKPVASFTYTDSANIYTFTNHSTHAVSYWWVFGDGGTSTAINPVNDYPTIGNFTAQLIAIGLCSNDTFSVSFATGINDVANPAAMQVYPNPCGQSLVVSHRSLVNTIEVYDLLGGKIDLPILFQTTDYCKLNTENLLSGIYFLKTIDNRGNSAIAKFVKE